MTRLISVAGDDPGCGVGSGPRAGLQADAEMARLLGTHFTGVIAVETEQDERGLRAVRPRLAGEVADALRHALFDAALQGECAVKTGALGDASVVDAVAEVLEDWPEVPLVVDPVRGASRRHPGAPPLLDAAGWQLLGERLAKRATLLTPSQAEADAAGGFPQAAAVLITGGDSGGVEVVDRLRTAEGTRAWRDPRLPGGEALHGTGCRLSAAIACALAQGLPLLAAVEAGRAATRAWIRAQLAEKAPPAPGE